MPEIALLDFLYLDLKRLESFASQLFKGVPDEQTDESAREIEVQLGVKGGIPVLLQGSGDTRALFSAGSTVTSRMHHYLVTRVIESLRERDLLLSDPSTAPDGTFVLVTGQLQILDPLGLAATLRLLPSTMKAATQLGGAATSNRQERQRQQEAASAQEKQFKTLADVIEAFGRDTVRIRVIENNESLATAVGERDKFVEPLDRLVLRHGYLTGDAWHVLGQVNAAGSASFYEPGSETFLDVLETTAITALQQVAAVLTASSEAWALTPLVVYREITGAP